MSLIDSANDILQLAIMSCNKPPKAIAVDIKYSTDMLYAALNGSRNIPLKARRYLSMLNPWGAMAVALEATGLPKIFAYLKIDAHPQPITYRLKINLEAAVAQVDKTQALLLEKLSREDLTDEEYQKLQEINYRLIDLLNFILNYAGRMDERYGLNLTTYMQGKEKPSAVTSRRQN